MLKVVNRNRGTGHRQSDGGQDVSFGTIGDTLGRLARDFIALFIGVWIGRRY